ncbi:MAG: hypothetical protein WEG36_07410 [Gemmatimonadota bacterium]
MTKLVLGFVLSAALSFSACSSSGPGSGGTVGSGATSGQGGAGGSAVDTGGGADGNAWPAVTDFAARGPFPIQREANVGPNAAYDIVRPAMLGAQGRKHPIISWNNGTLYEISRYQDLLDHWASHGFVVMGGHTNTTAGGAIHQGAIDWLVAENARTGSPYFGMLEVTKIGAAGHSQGGGASITAGANLPGPAGIVTTMPLMPIMSYQRPHIEQHAASMLIVSATEDARSNAVADQAFADITTEFVDAQFVGVHEDAMNPGIHGATVAWFRYQLMGDATAKAQFYPPAICGLCSENAWMRVRHKNSPP